MCAQVFRLNLPRLFDIQVLGKVNFYRKIPGSPVALENQASRLLSAQRRPMDHMLVEPLELVKKVEKGARVFT